MSELHFKFITVIIFIIIFICSLFYDTLLVIKTI
jgi:hypothetical protein